MDYGKVTIMLQVTFDNAPEGRHVAIAWMSNWQYANQVPTQQYRSGNSIPRDLGLFEYKGETYCSVVPSPEMTAARSKKAGKKLQPREMVVIGGRDHHFEQRQGREGSDELRCQGRNLLNG